MSVVELLSASRSVPLSGYLAFCRSDPCRPSTPLARLEKAVAETLKKVGQQSHLLLRCLSKSTALSL